MEKACVIMRLRKDLPYLNCKDAKKNESDFESFTFTLFMLYVVLSLYASIL